MPTLQSSPFFPVICADEAYEMNRAGVAYAPSSVGTPLHLEGTESPWLKNAVEEVHLRVRENKRKARGMEGHNNMNARSQRYSRPMSRSAVHNGRFPGMEYSSAGFAFRGGGNTETPEGRRFIQKLLKNRIGQYDALETGTFPSSMPVQEPVSANTILIDSALTSLRDQLSASAVGTNTLDAYTKFQTALLDEGASLSDNQISKYASVLGNMQEMIRSFIALPANQASATQKRIGTALATELSRAQEILNTLMRAVYESPEVRQTQARSIQSQLLSVPTPDYRRTRGRLLRR